jgi:SAM-dependent methyltransferase
MEAFKDHFSTNSASYARYRPHYPQALFDFVLNLCPHRRIAWDCATGNGQAALQLAPHFGHVIATDGSATQITNATPHPHIVYRVATAEESGIDPSSVDLITVAQALHWFDLQRFYAEVRRVSVHGGAIVVWSYGDPILDDPLLDAKLQQFNGETLASYWPSERHGVGEGYNRLPFPFKEVAPPSLVLEQRWTLEDFIGYIWTWSAVAAYRARHGVDPVISFERELASHWTGAGTTHLVRWPLTIRAGYVA